MEIGDVLYVLNKDIYPEGEKYSICVHITDSLFLLVNSDNRIMYECMPLKKTKDKNLFLQYDSYVGCNQVFTYSPEELRKSKHVGALNFKDLEGLHDHIRDNVKNMPTNYKNKILASLKETIDNCK